jgi:threonine dehydratase
LAAVKSSTQQVTIEDVLAARKRISQYLRPTPLRNYATLDEIIGHSIHVWVKHENHNPTNSFKVRNGLSAMTLLSDDEKKRGVVAATRGNHGLGLAWAGKQLGVPVTICVPVGNNPEKNADLRGLGVTLIEAGNDYDESIQVAQNLVETKGLSLIHSTNNCGVIAGAGTMHVEILEERADIDTMFLSVGGGSMAASAVIVGGAMRPSLKIYASQAEGASAAHDAWQAKAPLCNMSATTIAEGLATRQSYELTFPILKAGLTDFVTVTEDELADAVRLMIKTTHNLAEAAGVAGLAGLILMREKLAGKNVAIILSGSNIDEETLKIILNRKTAIVQSRGEHI